MSPATARMQRLLALVPWIAANDGPTVGEICDRFDLTPRQLLDDLEVVWLVGLPPYTPDVLIDVVQEGERIWVHFPDVFERPQRLTPDQGLALLVAGASLLALPDSDPDGPLARGVAKLAAVLGVDASQALEIDLGAGQSEILATLRTAIGQRRRVRIDYYSYGRDARAEREVSPVRLDADEGALYLLAHCHRAGAPRRFRLDRIYAAELLEEGFEPIEAPPESAVFAPDPDDPRVVLELGPGAGWALERYPVEHVEDLGEGRVRARLAVATDRWLERLLVRAGPDAVVVDGPEQLRDAGRRSAQRILARYRSRGR